VVLLALGIGLFGLRQHRWLRRLARLSHENTDLLADLRQHQDDLEAQVRARTGELQAANAALSREVVERRRSEEEARYLRSTTR
jgi:C4-dicarboxylate-specific signal transduction histidine kinase